jgi:hypothetical protein
MPAGEKPYIEPEQPHSSGQAPEMDIGDEPALDIPCRLQQGQAWHGRPNRKNPDPVAIGDPVGKSGIAAVAKKITDLGMRNPAGFDKILE